MQVNTLSFESQRNQAGMTSEFPSSVAVGYRIKYEVLEPIFEEELGPATHGAMLVERITTWSYTTKARRALNQILYPIRLEPGTHRADLLVLCRLVNRSTPDEYAEELVESETDKKVQKYVIEQFGGGLQESDVTFDVVKNVPFRK
ncbi:hypothetical protein H0H93_008555 [Arthromyces matolae]|nr:hypothetical protein H0H93_008555 [Arthromyces matolae]